MSSFRGEHYTVIQFTSVITNCLPDGIVNGVELILPSGETYLYVVPPASGLIDTDIKLAEDSFTV